jgi:hypothetical protein
MREYRIEHSPFWRHIGKEYGLTEAEYDALLATQGGKCAICGADNSGVKNKNGEYRQMCVDHDHVTGEVRGLLCNRCNLILGHAKDRPDIFPMFVEYLAHISGGGKSPIGG